MFNTQFNIHYRLLRSIQIGLAALVLGSASVWAESDCLAMAKTELEQLYCEVDAKGGRLNISFKEFRNNTEKTQRLLLARPAKRLGLVLPEITKSKTRLNTKPKTRPKPSEPKRNVSVNKVGFESVGPGLAGCELSPEQTKIVCERGEYQLLLNKPNARLSEGALSEENQFRIEPFNGIDQSPDQPSHDQLGPEQLKNYLGPAYIQYLAAMERLGLSATTMSYTRFYVTFQEARKLGLDFADRMFNMYELLKKEKASMNVDSQLPDKLPNALNQCYALGRQWLVCDNKHMNWVFLLENS